VKFDCHPRAYLSLHVGQDNLIWRKGGEHVVASLLWFSDFLNDICDFRILIGPLQSSLLLERTMYKTLYSRSSKVFLALLREVRMREGLSQAEVGKLLKESQDWVSKVENGVRRLDVVELHLWCRALNTTLGEFAALFEDRLGQEIERGIRRLKK